MITQFLEPATQLEIDAHRSSGRIVALDPWELPTSIELPPPSQNGLYRHVVIMFNAVTIDEQPLVVETKTPFYPDVQREIAHQKVMRGWIGYEVRAILESPCGF